MNKSLVIAVLGGLYTFLIHIILIGIGCPCFFAAPVAIGIPIGVAITVVVIDKVIGRIRNGK